MSTDTAGTSTEQGGTTHAELASWVKEVAELTQPDSIHWVTGSAEEIESLNQALVASGTFVKLDEEKKPNSYWAASQPSDVARVEERVRAGLPPGSVVSVTGLPMTDAMRRGIEAVHTESGCELYSIHDAEDGTVTDESLRGFLKTYADALAAHIERLS
mgnify:CR=1 FL=1